MTYWRLLLLLVCLAMLGGCHASPWATSKSDPAAQSASEAGKNNANSNDPKAGSNANATSLTPGKAGSPGSEAARSVATDNNPVASAQSLQEVMAEVRELGVLDPQSQNKLLEDLKQTDPALWPLLVKQVRAAVAYRRKTIDPGQPANGGMMAYQQAGNLPREPAGKSAEEMETTSASMPRRENSRYASDRLADNASDDPPARLPPARTAKALPKNTRKAQAIEDDSALASKSTPSPQKNVVKSNRGKTRDLRTLDVNALEADEQVTPVSYQAESGDGEEAVKSAANPNAREPVDTADWHALLGQTIKAMEADLKSKPKTAEDLSKQAQLRMMYALAGQRADAAKPISAAPPAMQDFWSKQTYGVSVLLDTERTPDAMSRAAEAKRQLSEGLTRLGELAPLEVRNLSFCTEVKSYGCYKLFKNYEFLAGQEVLLYAEVENFGIDSTPKGYHTSLRSSYQILDSNGQRIADHAMSTTEEDCQNQRRDFFIGYQFHLPSRINPGKYTLQLTIEDLKSQKVGQASVEMTIKSDEKEKTRR